MRSSTQPSKKRCPAWSRRRGLYNSLGLIQHNEFPHNQRAIGLWVDKAYRQPGSKQDLVEIEIETCQFIDSVSYVATVQADRWQSEARKRTQGILEDLDHIMRELAEHRARLVAELATLAQDPVETVTSAAEKTYHVTQVHTVEFWITADSVEVAVNSAHAAISAVTDDGAEVLCGTAIAPDVTLVDFDATFAPRDTAVEEDTQEDERTL